MSTLSRSSWGRVFDDLGVTLLEVAYGRIDVDQQIGRCDLFQRRAECRDQLGREVGHEPDGVGNDDRH